jgi:uncharacterized protein
MPAFIDRYGPWAIVTGASSGIGAEFARQLAQRGVRPILVARRAALLETMADELRARHGVEALPVPLDLGRMDVADRLARAVGAREVGLLVANAARVLTGPVLAQEPADEVDQLLVNCAAPLLLARRFAPAMVERGHGGVIVVASTLARRPGPGMVGYGASKAWDLAFADGLAAELGRFGVDVQALLPGLTRTEGMEQRMAGHGIPRRPADPADVARASLDGLGRRTIVVPGRGNRIASALVERLPRRLRWKLMERALVFRED